MYIINRFGGAIMEKEIKNFGYHLSIEKNLSKKTVTTYTNCLYYFTSYVTNIEKLEEITIPDIKAEMVKRYLIYLKERTVPLPERAKKPASIVRGYL